MHTTANNTDRILVEVAYALPDRQSIIAFNVPLGCTAYDAVKLSGLRDQYNEIDIDTAPMGIFGQRIKDPRQHVLQKGERVEVYRPLTIDPKEIRRLRAEAARKNMSQ